MTLKRRKTKFNNHLKAAKRLLREAGDAASRNETWQAKKLIYEARVEIDKALILLLEP